MGVGIKLYPPVGYSRGVSDGRVFGPFVVQIEVDHLFVRYNLRCGDKIKGGSRYI